MAKVLITEDYLSDIGDAIRGKLGGSTQYTPGQMASAINSIPTVAPTLISKSIVANGTYNASSDEADGYDSVSVNVPNSYASEDEGKVVNNGALVAQESQSITQNGTYDTTLKNTVVVNVPQGGGGDKSYTAYRIWTKSTGGNDASMYVQKGQILISGLEGEFTPSEEAESVLYKTVQTSPGRNFDDLFYLKYQSGWSVIAINKIIIDYKTYTNGQTGKNWAYNIVQDFYVIDKTTNS